MLHSPSLVIFTFNQMYADVSPEASRWFYGLPARMNKTGFKLKLIPHQCPHSAVRPETEIWYFTRLFLSLFLLRPLRSPGSQQLQRCERSHQQAEDARVQLKQSPRLYFPPSSSHHSSHMRRRRWLSPAGSHSMSWRSSSSCCPLQVCKI